MHDEPFEAAEKAHEASHAHHEASPLGARVAITIALLATFLGLCKIKSDSIVERMERLQVDRLDQWNFYQARNIRGEIGRAALTELQIGQASAGPAVQPVFGDAIKTYQALVADQDAKKEAVRQQAESDETAYGALEYRHDQFNLCEAAIALAISMLALTALTRKGWLFAVAIVPAAAGIVMGLAGLLSWPLHPDVLVRWMR